MHSGFSFSFYRMLPFFGSIFASRFRWAVCKDGRANYVMQRYEKALVAIYACTDSEMVHIRLAGL